MEMSKKNFVQTWEREISPILGIEDGARIRIGSKNPDRSGFENGEMDYSPENLFDFTLRNPKRCVFYTPESIANLQAGRVRVLNIDFDFKKIIDEAIVHSVYPSDLIHEIPLELEAMGIPPNLAVFSGGGLHLYYALKDRTRDFPEASALYLGLRDLIGGDSTAFTPRSYLRTIPLSFNAKYTHERPEGRRALPVYHNPELYTVEILKTKLFDKGVDLNANMEAFNLESELIAAATEITYKRPDVFTAQSISDALKNPRCKGLWISGKKSGDISHSGNEWSLGLALLATGDYFGERFGEIEAILECYNHGRGIEGRKWRERYLIPMLATKGRVQAYLKKNRRYSAIRDIARITRLDAAIVRKSLRYLELKKLIKSKERKGGKRRDIQYRLVKT